VSRVRETIKDTLEQVECHAVISGGAVAKSKGEQGISSLIEHLPSMFFVLESIPFTKYRKKVKRSQTQGKCERTSDRMYPSGKEYRQVVTTQQEEISRINNLAVLPFNLLHVAFFSGVLGD
jgi:hypothetical protein